MQEARHAYVNGHWHTIGKATLTKYAKRWMEICKLLLSFIQIRNGDLSQHSPCAVAEWSLTPGSITGHREENPNPKLMLQVGEMGWRGMVWYGMVWHGMA